MNHSLHEMTPEMMTNLNFKDNPVELLKAIRLDIHKRLLTNYPDYQTLLDLDEVIASLTSVQELTDTKIPEKVLEPTEPVLTTEPFVVGEVVVEPPPVEAAPPAEPNFVLVEPVTPPYEGDAEDEQYQRELKRDREEYAIRKDEKEEAAAKKARADKGKKKSKPNYDPNRPTQLDAILKTFDEQGHPMSLQELLKRVTGMGVHVGGKFPDQTLGATLYRYKNLFRRVHFTDRSYWGRTNKTYPGEQRWKA